MNRIILSVILTLAISFLINWLTGNNAVLNITQEDTCPYCFGLDYCETLSKDGIQPKSDSFIVFLNNLFSVKNVYVINNNMVLKQLGYIDDFIRLDRKICLMNGRGATCRISSLENRDDYKNEIVKFLSVSNDHTVNNFKICNDVNKFVDYILKFKNENVKLQNFYKNVWTILHINVEPLILQILNPDDWPVPKYYGACGRVIAEQYVGETLNHFKDNKWLDRAYMSVQLLEAAINFTMNHDEFRFYLTDISSDNIAVDDKLRIKFIDLENVIVKSKTSDYPVHTSEVFHMEGFAYSEKNICNNSISDHNYYAICKLLLSSHAPWPMMDKGLLHAIPKKIELLYPDLRNLIENCVEPRDNKSRFVVVEDLIKLLYHILTNHYYFESRT